MRCPAAMRRILVEHARHKKSLKAGGAARRVELASVEPALAPPDEDLLALHELGISASTADNDWAYARSWLRLEIRGETSRADRKNPESVG
jgi:hypothetical protein